MAVFDLRTIVLMSSVMPGLMALVLFSLRRGLPPGIHGVGNWASGALVVSLSALLLALRGHVPDWLSIVAANCGMIAGTGLWLAGSQRFFGLAPAWRSLTLLFVMGLAGFIWMTWMQPTTGGRTICISAILTLIYVRQSLVLLRYGRRDGSAVFLGVLFVFQTVVTVIRLVTTFGDGFAQAQLFGHDRIQAVYLGTGALMSLTVAVGFMLLGMNRLRQHLEQQSFVDPLTGLLNRRAFLSTHQNERETMMRTGGLMSLLLLDLDHFKAINDTHGHVKGDEILVDFSKRAAAALPPHHHFARWGGEEFAVLLPGTNPDQARAIAETVRLQIAAHDESDLPDYTCSIGIACKASGDATIERLVKDADEALYLAKRLGRNRVEISDQVILL